jgi:hypothetical protein
VRRENICALEVLDSPAAAVLRLAARNSFKMQIWAVYRLGQAGKTVLRERKMSRELMNNIVILANKCQELSKHCGSIQEVLQQVIGSEMDVKKALAGIDVDGNRSVQDVVSQMVKNNAQPGEKKPAEEQPTQAPTQPTPPTQEKTGPMYGFYPMDELQKNMEKSYPHVNWRSLIINSSELIGTTPADDISQAELARVYNFGPNGVGTIKSGEKSVNFIQSMVKKLR